MPSWILFYSVTACVCSVGCLTLTEVYFEAEYLEQEAEETKYELASPSDIIEIEYALSGVEGELGTMVRPTQGLSLKSFIFFTWVWNGLLDNVFRDSALVQ